MNSITTVSGVFDLEIPKVSCALVTYCFTFQICQGLKTSADSKKLFP